MEYNPSGLTQCGTGLWKYLTTTHLIDGMAIELWESGYFDGAFNELQEGDFVLFISPWASQTLYVSDVNTLEETVRLRRYPEMPPE